jgi:copper(I)-binding protein
VSRSTARFPSSGGRRAALLLTTGAASVALLSACGAGQISQTAMKVASVEGVSGSLGNIDVDNALVAYPAADRYTRGSSLPVFLTISNDGFTDDRLISVESPAGRAVLLAPALRGTTPPALGCELTQSEMEQNLVGPSSTRPAAPDYVAESPSSGATPSASASSAAQASPSASPAATVSVPATASASPSPSESAAPGSRSVTTTIPHDGAVLMTQSCPHLLVTGLREDLLPSEVVPLRLTFEKAGTMDLDVPVATADKPLPREEVPGFDPHGGGAAGHGAESPAAGHGAESPSAGHGTAEHHG